MLGTILASGARAAGEERNATAAPISTQADGFVFDGRPAEKVDFIVESACIDDRSGIAITWHRAGETQSHLLVDTRREADAKLQMRSGNTLRLAIALPEEATYRASLFLGCSETAAAPSVSLTRSHQVFLRRRIALSAFGLGGVGASRGFTPGVALSYGAQVTPSIGLDLVATAHVVATRPLAALGIVGVAARVGPEDVFLMVSLGVPAAAGRTSTVGGLGARLDLQFSSGELGATRYFLFSELHSYSLTGPEALVLGAGYAF